MKFKDFLICKRYEITDYFKNTYYIMKYPDYIDNEYNAGRVKFIWGITSNDDLSDRKPSLHTMNDIDITYDREGKLYSLGIETAYWFNSKNRKQSECEYLKELLNHFTQYMKDNHYSTDCEDLTLFLHSGTIPMYAESIKELYVNFKIFVLGFCGVMQGITNE